jgi:NTE family protein
MEILKKWFGKKTIHKGKVAIALGGGGARGVAHLGILKYLEDNGYYYDFLVGTSAGAIFGALYLLSQDSDEAYERLKDALEGLEGGGKFLAVTNKKSSVLANLKEKLYLAKSLFSVSILDQEPLREFLTVLIGKDRTFKDLKKTLYVVATDLNTGKDVIFSKGELLTPLIASSSLPGVFPPVKFRDYCLIDGGTTQKLPSGIASMLGAKKVLGVDVGSAILPKENFSRAAQVMIRSEEIASAVLHRQNRQATNLLLTPGFNDFKWYEFKRHSEAFDAGYSEALKQKRAIDRFFKRGKGDNRQRFVLGEESVLVE